MSTVDLISLVTFFATLILGYFSKKSSFIKNEMIPLQNLLVGVIVTVIEWIITKDIETSIMISGILAGGTYDIFHNLEKILKKAFKR